MVIIKFNVDDSKIANIIEAMVGLYPIPYIDEVPQFTEAQWAKECIRRWVIKQVARYNQLRAIKDCTYAEDDTLLS